MPKITSRDGAEIAFRTVGNGKPLVLVHGTCSSAARWAPVLPLLESRFSLHIVERRGRGDSGDRGDYALAREVEDVACVIESVGGAGGDVGLLGHSFGGLIALDVLLALPRLARVAVYEPPVSALGPLYSHEVLAGFEEKLARGDRQAVVESFFTDVLKVDAAALAATKALPTWDARLRAAHTLPREVRATNGQPWAPARFANVSSKVRVFVGGESFPIVADLMQMVAAAIPGADLVSLPGQKHIAMDTAPELFASEVTAFFGG